jgi:hypothetical protein
MKSPLIRRLIICCPNYQEAYDCQGLLGLALQKKRSPMEEALGSVEEKETRRVSSR